MNAFEFAFQRSEGGILDDRTWVTYPSRSFTGSSRLHTGLGYGKPALARPKKIWEELEVPLRKQKHMPSTLTQISGALRAQLKSLLTALCSKCYRCLVRVIQFKRHSMQPPKPLRLKKSCYPCPSAKSEPKQTKSPSPKPIPFSTQPHGCRRLTSKSCAPNPPNLSASALSTHFGTPYTHRNPEGHGNSVLSEAKLSDKAGFMGEVP